MALPVTLSDFSWPADDIVWVGPFISSGGNVYVVGREASDTTYVGIWKATDPTSSFTEAARWQISAARQVRSIQVEQVGDTLNLFVQVGETSTYVGNPVWRAFSMASDTFPAFGRAASMNDPYFPANHAVAGAQRSTGSDVIMFWNRPGYTTMGKTYGRICAARSAGGANNFGADTQIGLALTSTTQQSESVETAVLGTSDRVHLFWSRTSTTAGGGTALMQRTVKSTDNLDGTAPATSEQDVTGGSTMVNNSIADTHHAAGRAFCSSGGVLIIPAVRSADSYLLAWTASDADTPSWTGTVVSAAAVQTGGPFGATTKAATIGGAPYDGTNKTAAWVDRSAGTQDPMYDKDTGSGWGTDTSIEATASTYLSANVFQRGSNIVLAAVYDKSGTFVYNEAVLRAVTGQKALDGKASESDAARATANRAAGLTGRTPEADNARAPILARSRALATRADEADAARATISRSRALAGRGDEANSARGDLTVSSLAALDGKASESDAARGTLTVTRTLAGRANEADASRGTLTRSRALTGRADEADNALGTATLARTLTGRADEADATRAELVRERALAGITPESDASRALLIAARPIAGRADEANNTYAGLTVSALADGFRVARALDGPLAEADASRGDLTVEAGGQAVALDGYAAEANGARAAVSATRPVDGYAAEANAVTLAGVGGALALDSTGAATAPAAGNGPVTWSHTIGAADTGRLLMVACGQEAADTGGSTPTVTFNGVAMTLAVDSGYPPPGSPNAGTAQVFYMLDATLPAAGTYTVSVTYSTTPNATRCWGRSVSVVNAAQTAPDDTTLWLGVGQTARQDSLDVVGTGGWAIDMLTECNGSQTYTADGGQVNVATDGTLGTGFASSTKPEAGAGTTTLGWTWGSQNGQSQAHVVAEWRAAGSAEGFQVARAVATRPATADNATATALARAAALDTLAPEADAARADLSVTAGGVPRALDGYAAEADDARATVTRQRALAATGPEANDAHAEATLARPLAATGPEADNATAALARSRALAATGPEANSALAELTVIRSLIGQGDEADNAITTLTRTRALAGTGDEADNATSTLVRTRALTGRGDESNAARVTLGVTRTITSYAPTADAATATTVLRAAAITGRADEADDARGDLDIAGQVVLDGHAAEASSAVAALSKLGEGFRVARALDGPLAEADAARATTIIRAAALVTTAPEADAARADLSTTHGQARALDGYAAEADSSRGTVERSRALAATAPEADEADATTFARAAELVGRAASADATTGELAISGQVDLAGTASVASGGQGALARSCPLDGEAPEADAARALLGRSRALSVPAPAADAATGSLVASRALVARSGSSSSAAGDLFVSPENALAGTSASSSSAQAALGVIRYVAARAPEADGARGTPLRLRAFVATAPTSAWAGGTVARAAGVDGRAPTSSSALLQRLDRLMLFDGHAVTVEHAFAPTILTTSGFTWRRVNVAVETQDVPVLPTQYHVMVQGQRYRAEVRTHHYTVVVTGPVVVLAGGNIR